MTVPNPTYQMCTLNGYTYRYNPAPSVNYPQFSLAKNVGINGSTYVAYPFYASDRAIKQTWSLIEAEVYWQLYELHVAAAGCPVLYIDEWGNEAWVIIASLTYESYTPASGGFQQVSLILMPTDIPVT